MLHVAVQVLDRFLKLLQERKKRNRQFFADHIAPLLSELEGVQQDYSACFAEAIEILSDKTIPDKEVATRLSNRRRTLSHIRTKLYALAEAMASPTPKLPQEASLFFHAVCSYFRAGSGNTWDMERDRPPGASWMTSLLDIIEYLGKDWHFTRDSCIRYAQELRRELDLRWKYVVSSYAEVRRKYLD